MVKIINAGIIGCNMTEDFFKTSGANRIENFRWKKIYLKSDSTYTLKDDQPERVAHADAIINDTDIELVFVSANCLHYVKPIIEAGKSVRVI